jgi:hypothetical protein
MCNAIFSKKNKTSAPDADNYAGWWKKRKKMRSTVVVVVVVI